METYESAQESAPPASQPAPVATSRPAGAWDFLNGERLTGDWGGFRTQLEQIGIQPSLALTSVYQHNARGGSNTRNAHEITGSTDFELTLDLGAMGVLEGGTVYVLSESSWGDGISERGDVGDLFGVNGDAAGDRAIDVTELWYEQSIGERFRFRVGKIDLTVDFDTNAYANDETAQFLNNSLINTGNAPFPDNGLGMQFVATPLEWLYFGAGVMDAHGDARETGFRTAFHGPDEFFSVYEVGLTPAFQTRRGLLPGSYRFGLWYDPQPKEEFFNDLGGRRRTVPVRTDDLGFYLSFDQRLFKEQPDDEGDDQGLGVFFRYGYTHSEVNEIEDFWSVGGQYQGLIPTRDADVMAFGVAQGILSHDLKQTGMRPERETVLELYYNIQLLPWLNISPDFQWILDPGGEEARDAFVAGIRIQALF